MEHVDRYIEGNTIRLYVKEFSHLPHWMQDAECSLNDDGSLDPIKDASLIAEKYCSTCVVVEQCRKWATTQGATAGVYGGEIITPEE